MSSTPLDASEAIDVALLVDELIALKARDPLDPEKLECHPTNDARAGQQQVGKPGGWISSGSFGNDVGEPTNKSDTVYLYLLMKIQSPVLQSMRVEVSQDVRSQSSDNIIDQTQNSQKKCIKHDLLVFLQVWEFGARKTSGVVEPYFAVHRHILQPFDYVSIDIKQHVVSLTGRL